MISLSSMFKMFLFESLGKKFDKHNVNVKLKNRRVKTMKSIKYLVVLVCISIGISSVAKAQVYSGGTIYYKQTNSNSDYISIWEFNGRQALYKCRSSSPTESQSNIKTVMVKSPNAFDDHSTPGTYKVDGGWIKVIQAEYRPDIPSSDRSVYKVHSFFVAVSSDLSTMISWTESSNGVIENKRYFIRIEKDDLLPQAINYDFLDD